MTRTLNISDTGLRLIKAFEGYRPVDRELITGVRVVGYGHRLESEESVSMSRREAEEQLLIDLEPIEMMVNDEVHAPLSQGQYDALCSLAFNIGPDAFRESDIVRAMNNGRVLDAANGFDVWRKATINGKTYVVDALMRRRTAEKSLFLRNEPAVPAPSALLVPKPDQFAPLGPTGDGLPEFTDTDAIGIVPDVAIDADESVSELGADAQANIALLTVVDVVATDDDLEDIVVTETDALITDVSDEIDDEYDDLDEEIDVLENDDEPDSIVDDQTSDADDQSLNASLEDEGDENDPSDDEAKTLVDDGIEAQTEAETETETETETEMGLAPEDSVDNADIDDDDVFQLQVTDAVETPDLIEEPVSAIAAAADSLGDRLTALLDSDEETDQAVAAGLPTSLTGAEGTDVMLSDLSAADDNLADADDAAIKDGQRSNLLSFPKRELVLEDSVPEIATDTTEVSAEVTPEVIAEPLAEQPQDHVLVIDNLEADDVLRSSRDPENPVFDPDGDPVENAMRYLERQADERSAEKTGGGLWVPLALGGLLVGASAVMIGRGATEVLNAWGPTAATATAITGGVLVLFTIYAAARGRFA